MMAFMLVVWGCSGAQTQKMPTWVMSHPGGMGGKVAGVGSCRRHINGFSAQRQVAIRRGLDEIAIQKNVTISNATLMGTTGTRAGTSTSMESWSLQTVDKQTVSATIKDSWIDPTTEELFVWMVAD